MIIKNKKIIHIIIQSYFSTWTLGKVSRIETGNIINIVFFLLTSLFFYHVSNRRKEYADEDKRIPLTSIILSVLFTLMYMFWDGRHFVEGLSNPIFRVGVLAATFFGFAFLFYNILLYAFSCLVKKEKITVLLVDKKAWEKTNFFYQHFFLCSFFICIICWMPYFLYQFPGIMTPDSVNQVEQAVGAIAYTNHHPWPHTMLIKFFFNIGYGITKSMVAGVAFYTIAQMCFLSLSISYFINTLKKIWIKPVAVWIIIAFYALVPYHAVFAITMWKDIPFAGAVLLMITAMLRITIEGNKWTNYVCVSVGTLLMCLTRTNGWYAFIICFPIMFAFYLKKNKILLIHFTGVLITVCIMLYPLMNAFHVIPSDSIVPLSIPVQQIAAVLVNDRPVNEEELKLIDDVIDRTYIKDLYSPSYAENIKELVRAGHPEVIEQNKGKYIKLWLQLLCKYPGDYLEAYIQQTYANWFPDNSYEVAEAEGIYQSDLELTTMPLIRGPLVIKGKEIAIKLNRILPVYGMLWSMGAIFWLFVFAVGTVIVRKESKKLIYFAPCFFIWLSIMVATSAATEFRYQYYLTLCIPYYFVLMLVEDKKKEEKNE